MRCVIQGGPLPVLDGVITFYNPYKWPYKLVTRVITLLITSRGPPCGRALDGQVIQLLEGMKKDLETWMMPCDIRFQLPK